MKPLLALIAAVMLIVQPAGAADLDLSYQAVMHIRASEAAPVLDNPDHLVGIGAFRGLAILADGEIVRHRYDGWFDLTQGSGKFHGYALWRFADGSELRAAYDGEARRSDKEAVEVAARFREFSGTGRFAGVSGEGGFAGRRYDPIDQGGATYLKGSLSLSLPD